MAILKLKINTSSVPTILLKLSSASNPLEVIEAGRWQALKVAILNMFQISIVFQAGARVSYYIVTLVLFGAVGPIVRGHFP